MQSGVAGQDEQRSGAHLRALQTAATALTQLRAVEQLAAVAGAAAREGLGAEVMVIAIHEEDDRRLLGAYVARLRSEARQRLISIPLDGPSLIAQVARTGRAVYQSSKGRAGRPVSALRPGNESVAVLPLPATYGPVGVLVIGRPGNHGFSDEETAFMSVLAALCASAVGRVRLSAERPDVRRRGRLRIDLEQLQVEVDGRSATLTPTEMRLLMFLAHEPGRPRTRGEILRHLWHTEHVGGERACDAHIWNLRRKIERDPARPELVVTRRGVGYALELD